VTAPNRHSVSVAAVVTDDQDRVLVVQRRDNGKWEIPGGILELAESIHDGVRREVEQETGVLVEPERLTGSTRTSSSASSPSSSVRGSSPGSLDPPRNRRAPTGGPAMRWRHRWPRRSPSVSSTRSTHLSPPSGYTMASTSWRKEATPDPAPTFSRATPATVCRLRPSALPMYARASVSLSNVRTLARPSAPPWRSSTCHTYPVCR
jgi:hypothetical protein